jgi:hypothetical protein
MIEDQAGQLESETAWRVREHDHVPVSTVTQPQALVAHILPAKKLKKKILVAAPCSPLMFNARF